MSILKSRKFWISVIAVIQTIVFSLVPDFPAEVWQAINVVLLFLVGMIAVEDAALKFGAARENLGLLGKHDQK